MPPQTAPADDARGDGEGDVDRGGTVEREPDPAGRRGADEDLALAADVEQAGAERQRDAETGGDQRHGVVDRARDRAIACANEAAPKLTTEPWNSEE